MEGKKLEVNVLQLSEKTQSSMPVINSRPEKRLMVGT